MISAIRVEKGASKTGSAGRAGIGTTAERRFALASPAVLTARSLAAYFAEKTGQKAC